MNNSEVKNNNTKNKPKKRRKLSIQKIFNLVSATFILACCIFYGTRFIKLYTENNKETEVKTLAKDIINKNKENKNFKNIGGKYYFSNDEQNNYISYSNLIWRIIRINEDNTLTLVLENSITSLAAGSSSTFEDSYLNSWLNYQDKDYTGILENNLNSKETYLENTSTCNDIIDDTKTITCKNTASNIYITIPSLNDYINTGGSNSFMNNEEYFYLINYNKEGKIWYVDNDGKIGTSNKTDIIGIKPVITLKSTVPNNGGDGSIDNPYKIETESGLFGSYVKLDNDIWRVINVDENNVKLSLNSYAKINDTEVTYKYSNNGYYHNDTKANSLAYYLNNNYLNVLSYKNIIGEVQFANGIYGNTTSFDYTDVLKTTVPTKIAPLSIGDIIINPKLTNYYTSTGISKDENLIYVMSNNFKTNTKNGTSNLKIVPTIEISKELLTKGNGTIESPFEV